MIVLIKNEADFNELKFILKISSICIEAVLEDKDIELAYEVFFQIERKIEKEKLYKKPILFNDSELFTTLFF